MRRKDREITDMVHIMEIVERESVCCVAFHDDPCPYLIPLNYGAELENGKLILYFHGAPEGTKLERMKQNANVSFTVFGENRLRIEKASACASSTSFDSVCGSGLAELVAEQEKKRALAILMNHLNGGKEKAFDENSFPDTAVEKTIVWKITAEKVTGKHHD